MRSVLLLGLVALAASAATPAAKPAAPATTTSTTPACEWAGLYTIRHDAAAQRASAIAMAMEDDPDSPDARPPGVVVVRTAVKANAGCDLPGSPDPPTPAQAAAMPRPPAALKSSLPPLPPPKSPGNEATPLDGKTAGGAAPARQQMAPPGPPGPIPYNNLIIFNNFTEKIAVVTAGVEFTRPGYYPGVPAQGYADRWAVRGWFWVQPGQKTLVFSTRANKAWYYAQTNSASRVWGGSNTTDVAVYPGDVPFSTAAGGYVSGFTTTADNPAPRINPYYMAQHDFTNGMFDAVNQDAIVVLNA